MDYKQLSSLNESIKVDFNAEVSINGVIFPASGKVFQIIMLKRSSPSYSVSNYSVQVKLIEV